MRTTCASRHLGGRGGDGGGPAGIGSPADGQQAQRRPPRRHTKNFVARAISAAIHFFVSKAVPLLVARFSVTMLLSCFAPLIVFDFRSLQIYQVRRASVLANALARPLA